ncbi:unnamed protein product [Sympodiomycopsis kandeliae]
MSATIEPGQTGDPPSRPSLPSETTSSSNLSSPNATPRPIRGIKRKLPDHPTPLTERSRTQGNNNNSNEESPRKRQGTSTTPSRTSTPRLKGSRKDKSNDTPKVEIESEEKEEQEQEEQTEEERKDEELFHSWKEEYFEIVEQLPLELHRSTALMKELEGQIQNHLDAIHKDTLEYRDYRKQSFTNSAAASAYTRHSALDRIAAACSMAMASSEEKVGLALSAYNLIDRHCRRLDADLAKMTGIKPGAGNDAVDKEGATAPLTSDATKDTAPFALRAETQESSKSQRAHSRNLKDHGTTVAGATTAAAKDLEEESPERTRGSRPRRAAAAATTTSASNTPARKNKAGRRTGTLVLEDKDTQVPTAAASTVEESNSIPDMPVDPNEPVYCYCRGPSSGTMVGCENLDCPREWFHLPCVGLTQEPPEHVKWYCEDCKPGGRGAGGGGGGGAGGGVRKGGGGGTPSGGGRKKKRKSIK